MKQQEQKKREMMQKFKQIYIDILKQTKSNPDPKALENLQNVNEEYLQEFKDAFTLDSNSIEFLPAYFNFIELSLFQKDNLGEVKKYLIVGWTNLLNASKKKDDKSELREIKGEYDDDEVNKKLLQSRLDWLFGRFNLLIKSAEQAVDKLTSSIITFSEIYGPESVGLTPQLYYLSDYFLDFTLISNDTDEKNKRIIVKNIYLKIADFWRQYFNDQINPKPNQLFLRNDDTEWWLALGETYVKWILKKITIEFPKDSEMEMELKFKLIKLIFSCKGKLDYYQQEKKSYQDWKAKFESKISDKAGFHDWEEYLDLVESGEQ